MGELEDVARAGGQVVVLGLARGGIPVAGPIAEALQAPLDVLIVRKLGLPGQPELAMGAVAGVGDDTHVVRNEQVLAYASEEDLAEVLEAETRELRRREAAYRGGRPALDVRDRVVVLVDDGLATGSSMRAAVEAVRRQRPAEVIVAVPVGGDDACRQLEEIADRVVCAWIPRGFAAVGQAYQDFSPVDDEEVRQVLAKHS